MGTVPYLFSAKEEVYLDRYCLDRIRAFYVRKVRISIWEGALVQGLSIEVYQHGFRIEAKPAAIVATIVGISDGRYDRFTV